MTIDPQSLREVALSGTAVSRGVALGNAVRLHGTKRQFFRVSIAAETVEIEIGRLRRAVQLSKDDLSDLAGSESALPPGSRSIFDAHLLILEQSKFVEDVGDAIHRENVTAEWAITRIAESLANKLRTSADPHIREKYLDVQDVAERILNALSPEAPIVPSFWKDAVIVASTVRPSTMVELSRHRPLAIVTEHGGWTSHAFIMAREMGIPAVTGLKDLCRNVMDGDLILVDGFSGRAVVRPRVETVARTNRSALTNPVDREKAENLSAPLATLDGREVIIRANVEHFFSSAELQAKGSQGIGLLRSEYLFDQKIGSFPSEEEQYQAYRAVAKRAGSEIVRIRTFDLNADQITLNVIDRDKNPSLGLRAIRLSLADESNFRAQIRAIIRARDDYPFTIILPMISGTEEVIRAREIIANEHSAIRGFGAIGPRVGVMIEVPSAVMLIDEIVKIVDLVCIGTNDLVQYLLAADRDNESVAGWYQTLHPAVIRAIRGVLSAAEAADIPAVICGEMAGSTFYTPLLIGLGAREFSMTLNSIAGVRQIISGISYEESAHLADQLSSSASTGETERALQRYYHEKWPHLFDHADLETGMNKIIDAVPKK